MSSTNNGSLDLAMVPKSGRLVQPEVATKVRIWENLELSSPADFHQLSCFSFSKGLSHFNDERESWRNLIPRTPNVSHAWTMCTLCSQNSRYRYQKTNDALSTAIPYRYISRTDHSTVYSLLYANLLPPHSSRILSPNSIHSQLNPNIHHSHGKYSKHRQSTPIP